MTTANELVPYVSFYISHQILYIVHHQFFFNCIVLFCKMDLYSFHICYSEPQYFQ